MKSFLVGCVLLIGSSSAFAQAVTVFSGKPVVKVSEAGIERVAEVLENDRAVNLKCVISRIGGKYYWASRENREMERFEYGAFVTFVAARGLGYVKLVKPNMKDAAALMSETEEKFDYIEHIIQGLRTITYFGMNVTE
jgi:hypothetical protein